MKYPVYNQKGEEVGNTLLPKEVFDVKINPDLIHQVVVSQMANKRKATAHTKDRSEARGGGKKPWQQKGTGRARVGSIRSPIWKGGGVTFGPRKDKKFKKIIPKKIRRKALLMVLTGKAQENLLIIPDKLKIEKPKTKEIFKTLNKLPSQGKKCLIALPDLDKNLVLAARNIPQIKIIEARNLNCLDLLSFKYLVIPKETIKVIKETFIK